MPILIAYNIRARQMRRTPPWLMIMGWLFGWFWYNSLHCWRCTADCCAKSHSLSVSLVPWFPQSLSCKSSIAEFAYSALVQRPVKLDLNILTFGAFRYQQRQHSREYTRRRRRRRRSGEFHYLFCLECPPLSACHRRHPLFVLLVLCCGWWSSGIPSWSCLANSRPEQSTEWERMGRIVWLWGKLMFALSGTEWTDTEKVCSSSCPEVAFLIYRIHAPRHVGGSEGG